MPEDQDAFDDEFDDLDGEDQGQRQPNPVRDARLAKRRAEKKVKDLEAELTELREWRKEQETTARKSAAANAFEAVGLTAKQAELFPADQEITAENVKAFALEYFNLAPADEEELAPVETAERFVPVTVAGSAPARGQLTNAQYEGLVAQGKVEEAAKALREGRVADKPTDGSRSDDW